MFGSFVKVSRIRQKSWFSGNSSALRAVKLIILNSFLSCEYERGCKVNAI